jgi:hypothetical protein
LSSLHFAQLLFPLLANTAIMSLSTSLAAGCVFGRYTGKYSREIREIRDIFSTRNIRKNRETFSGKGEGNFLSALSTERRTSMRKFYIHSVPVPVRIGRIPML